MQLRIEKTDQQTAAKEGTPYTDLRLGLDYMTSLLGSTAKHGLKARVLFAKVWAS